MSNTAIANPAVADIVTRTRMIADLFTKDLGAMSEEMLGSCPGGKARCAYDLVYEVVAINRLTASKAAQAEYNMPGSDGWLRAPEDYKSKEVAIKDFQDS